MPIYEYQCESCQHQFDVMQKISDDPLKECPACQQNTLKKLISAPAFHLKGNGWYVTDFRNTKKASSTETSESKPSDQTQTEKKTETTESKSTESKKTTD